MSTGRQQQSIILGSGDQTPPPLRGSVRTPSMDNTETSSPGGKKGKGVIRDTICVEKDKLGMFSSISAPSLSRVQEHQQQQQQQMHIQMQEENGREGVDLHRNSASGSGNAGGRDTSTSMSSSSIAFLRETDASSSSAPRVTREDVMSLNSLVIGGGTTVTGTGNPRRRSAGAISQHGHNPNPTQAAAISKSVKAGRLERVSHGQPLRTMSGHTMQDSNSSGSGTSNITALLGSGGSSSNNNRSLLSLSLPLASSSESSSSSSSQSQELQRAAALQKVNSRIPVIEKQMAEARAIAAGIGEAKGAVSGEQHNSVGLVHLGPGSTSVSKIMRTTNTKLGLGLGSRGLLQENTLGVGDIHDSDPDPYLAAANATATSNGPGAGTATATVAATSINSTSSSRRERQHIKDRVSSVSSFSETFPGTRTSGVSAGACAGDNGSSSSNNTNAFPTFRRDNSSSNGNGNSDERTRTTRTTIDVAAGVVLVDVNSNSISNRSGSPKVFVPPISIEAISDKGYAHSYAAPTSTVLLTEMNSGCTSNEIKAKENDRVIYKRLAEAKALDRNKKTASGATMHSFSLWSNAKKNISPVAPATATATTTTTAPIVPLSSLSTGETDAVAAPHGDGSMAARRAAHAAAGTATSTTGKSMLSTPPRTHTHVTPPVDLDKTPQMCHGRKQFTVGVQGQAQGEGQVLDSIVGPDSSAFESATATALAPGMPVSRNLFGADDINTNDMMAESASAGKGRGHVHDFATPVKNSVDVDLDSNTSASASGSRGGRVASSLRSLVGNAKAQQLEHSPSKQSLHVPFENNNDDNSTGDTNASAAKSATISDTVPTARSDYTGDSVDEDILPAEADTDADGEKEGRRCGYGYGYDDDDDDDDDDEISNANINVQKSGTNHFNVSVNANAHNHSNDNANTMHIHTVRATSHASNVAAMQSAIAMKVEKEKEKEKESETAQTFDTAQFRGGGGSGSGSGRSHVPDLNMNMRVLEAEVEADPDSLLPLTERSNNSGPSYGGHIREHSHSNGNGNGSGRLDVISPTLSELSHGSDDEVDIGRAEDAANGERRIARRLLATKEKNITSNGPGPAKERIVFHDAPVTPMINKNNKKVQLQIDTIHVTHTTQVDNTDTGMSTEVEPAQIYSPLRWKRGALIGEGTFGKVYKGMNERTGELLAVKQLSLIDGSQEDVEGLQKEISVMWHLDHANIVRYLGTARSERYLFIVIEFVSGGSIANMLQQFGPFIEKLIRRFTLHILSGVQYLHEKCIIHRDIKGANVLVTNNGMAKLADFGCSKQLAGMCTASMEESMRAIRGSVPWMAPEVIKQSGHGRSSDMWSVGATVIEMGTGKPPWPEFTNNLAALFHVATSKHPPPPPSHLSKSCANFLNRCMQIEPSARATAAQLLATDSFILCTSPHIESVDSAVNVFHDNSDSHELGTGTGMGMEIDRSAAETTESDVKFLATTPRTDMLESAKAAYENSIAVSQLLFPDDIDIDGASVINEDNDAPLSVASSICVTTPIKDQQITRQVQEGGPVRG